VVLDVLEVLEGTGDLPAVDGLSGLAGVLERDTEVGTASAGALGVLDFGSGVTDLEESVLVGCVASIVVCGGAHFGRAVNWSVTGQMLFSRPEDASCRVGQVRQSLVRKTSRCPVAGEGVGVRRCRSMMECDRRR
jgi:hypothetical protein